MSLEYNNTNWYRKMTWDKYWKIEEGIIWKPQICKCMTYMNDEALPEEFKYGSSILSWQGLQYYLRDKA